MNPTNGTAQHSPQSLLTQEAILRYASHRAGCDDYDKVARELRKLEREVKRLGTAGDLAGLVALGRRVRGY